ncbi:LacI family transcriptional regulator [Subtercola sp. Z020]|uniref:LacI family DNA-binding transcriptional regulator n=1 Tax=Subtercola sp. Z020 TaxID=2080582 RepID=UPI000CE79351|nr:LacI family DNA-binding transcriptional regulator [Subtercola sp. Z020]PPF79299.1 LacI family transcriptional regulator [Subtercola sp. Z020]
MTDARKARLGLPQPNMADVARHAGVAIGTVSNTLNNPEKVREPTRRRVLASIDALGFVRNDAARSLAAGSSDTVGIVLVDMGNSFFVDIARGAEATLREHGMNLLIANSDIEIEKQLSYLEVFEQARVAGILLAPLDPHITKSLVSKAVSRPLVLVNYAPEDAQYAGVVADEHHGGYIAARHLIELGRRNLVFAGGPFQLQAVAERLAGVRRAVGETAGTVLSLVETTGMNISHGRTAGERIIAQEEHVDGVVAASDLVAIGIIQVLEQQPDLRIPEDIAVVGYDNNHFASESTTPVTTISQPGEEMGRAAAELLIAEIRGDGGAEKRTVVLRPHLIPRRSTIGTASPADLQNHTA